MCCTRKEYSVYPLFVARAFVAFLLTGILVFQVSGQDIKRHFIIPNPVRPDSFATKFAPTPPGLVGMEDVWIRFTLDWTHCQVHLGNDAIPIEIVLTGTVASNYPEIWNLNAISPVPGGLPILYFNNDILGRGGQSYGTNVPLTWEISFNNNPFIPMTIQPNNALTTIIPPGLHAFRVRITANPQPGQGHGYYNLQMGQCILPQL